MTHGTWRNIKVRHPDGRSGTITSDYVGFGHRALRISIDDGGEAHVQLNTDGVDSGEPDWTWFCENHDGGPKWLPLGPQTDKPTP
jgi:hypothetical protein